MKLTNSTLTLLSLLLVLASLNFDRSRYAIEDSQAHEIIPQSSRTDTIPAGTSTASPSLERTVLGKEYTLHIDADSPNSQPGDYIYFHYVMRTADSILVISRNIAQEPYTQNPGDTISLAEIDEVTDVVRSLSVGDSATVAMRIDTFSTKPPGLENVDVIYFDIAITKIIDEATFDEQMLRAEAEAKARRQAVIARAPEVLAFADSVRQAYLAGNLEDLQQTDSGLEYVIHEPGQGPPIETEQMLDVHYIGMLTDGTIFDQSYKRGQPINFPIGVGAVISGWDEGLSLLNTGAHATFFIPAELGYGEFEQGPIPANSDLIFYVEVELNE